MDGVGQKRLQLDIRISMLVGLILCLDRRSSTIREENLLNLFKRCFKVTFRWKLVQCNRHASFISDAGSFHNSFLELTAVCTEDTADMQMLYEGGDCDSQVIWRKIAGEVNEIDHRSIGSDQSEVEKVSYDHQSGDDHKEESRNGERSFKYLGSH
ncbi:hypothetical protein OIU85_026910 [Salix viminalis]|uniref:Uncharacterized protein n=1 Tax=Salix viminalis TaxID=40686 RepID=A0A9Q0TPP8_SALVM|nr:hypothetical protein OIU85_026910 [Salix viminalis]